MRQDLMTGGTPRRLTQHLGTWVLEVERLVALDGTVFRPHTQRLEGPEQIAAYFRRNPQVRQLAQGLQRLLEASAGVVTQSFEAVSGEWIPSALGPEHLSQLQQQAKAELRRDDRLQLIEVKTELYRLRAECQWLKQRLVKLEQGLADGSLRGAAGAGSPSAGARSDWPAAGMEALASTPPANDVGVTRGGREQAPGAGTDRAEQVGARAAEASIGETNRQDAAVDARADQGVAAADAASRHMQLPMADDLSRCLRQLVGGDVTSEETDQHIGVREPGELFYVSTLVDDDGTEAGAILLDLKAAVFLGGTLMMIPEATLKAQVARKEPSEDCLEASAEVCNSLSAVINKVADNPHVMTAPLVGLEADKLPWLMEARQRIDLVDSFGGHLVLVAR